MTKMVYDFFLDEEGFESAGLTQRFDSVQAGINDLDVSGCTKGCLNAQHIPSFMTTAETKEFPVANKVTPNTLECGYGVTSDETAGPGEYINGDSYYYNLLNSNGPDVCDCRQKPMPDDGVWEPIISSYPILGLPLELKFPATDFTEYVNPTLIVMMNVHVERLAFDWVGTSWPQGTAALGEWLLGQGVAFAIQMHDAINDTWHHIYDPLGVANGSTNRLRRTERRVGAYTTNHAYPPVDDTSTTLVPIYRDISIRCAITANDLFNAYDENGEQYQIEKIDKVRGVLSLIAMTGYQTFHGEVQVNLYCGISNANLSIFMPRCKERN